MKKENKYNFFFYIQCATDIATYRLIHPRVRFSIKLDGVGPVDNRPSTDKLHQIVRKKKEKKMTCDI